MHAQFSVNGRKKVYDKSSNTYFTSIPETSFGKDYSATVALDTDSAWSHLKIEGKDIETAYIFQQVEANREYSLQAQKDEKDVNAKIVFTFLPKKIQMINNLSILIPTYNKVCLELVKKLQVQASSLSDFRHEILVADDGSTEHSTIEGNRAINSLEHCRYIEREKNEGRAVIRNFLAAEAQYEWLLFIDSNMSVISSQYLANVLL